VGDQAPELDHAGVAELQRRVARRQHLVGRQSAAREVATFVSIMPDADVNLSPFQHRRLLGTKRLGQLHVHARKELGIPGQERRQDALDRLRRGRDLQHAAVSAPKQLDPFAERADVTQQATAISKQLRADGGQDQPAAYPIKQPETELLLELANLARKRGLADAQAQRRPGDRAQLGDGDEGAQALEVHGRRLSHNRIKAQKNYALDI
jgi:hypothetical protein